MSDRLARAIQTFFVEKGLAQANDTSLANELAERLKEQPPGWDWHALRAAMKNPGVHVAIIGIVLTGLMLYLTFEQSLFVRGTPERQPLPILPSLVAIGWLVGPPLYFFIELYFRGTSREAREMVQTYQQAAQRIWLAVAAVLVALYELSFKP